MKISPGTRKRCISFWDNLCLTLSCTWASLNIVAPSRGLVYGHLSFKVDGKSVYIGKSTRIPDENRLVEFESFDDLAFILVVEKETVFRKIMESFFCKRYGCILVTGKGIPDVGCRLFLKKLRIISKLPVFALMDGNPYGICIMSIYKHGSMLKAFDNERMAVRDLKWIGIHPDDKILKGLEKDVNLTNKDVNLCRGFLKKQWVKDDSQLEKHIRLTISKFVKYQIEHFIQSDYVTNVYLPSRLALRK